MEKWLLESNEWLFTILRAIDDYVIATDRKGLIAFMNPAASELAGFTLEEARGMRLQDILILSDPDTGDKMESLVNNLEKKEDSVCLDALKVSSVRQGREFVAHIRVTPIKDRKGSRTGYSLLFKDISRRKNLEEELLKAQKLESIGTLAGGIAHEFNNLLTAILGNISLLKFYINESDDAYECVADAESSSLRAKSLARQMLIFSRGASQALVSDSMAEQLKDSVTFASKGSKVQCEFSACEDLWQVDLDSKEMSQVIGNVILNAAQAISEGGNIKVTAENMEKTDENELPLALQKGKYAKITVKDKGEGIPRECLPQIFDPSFIIEQVGKGPGLAVSYYIVKKHAGHIEIQSTAGVGTSVIIYLPAS